MLKSEVPSNKVRSCDRAHTTAFASARRRIAQASKTPREAPAIKRQDKNYNDDCKIAAPPVSLDTPFHYFRLAARLHPRNHARNRRVGGKVCSHRCGIRPNKPSSYLPRCAHSIAACYRNNVKNTMSNSVASCVECSFCDALSHESLRYSLLHQNQLRTLLRLLGGQAHFLFKKKPTQLELVDRRFVEGPPVVIDTGCLPFRLVAVMNNVTRKH